MRGAIPPFSQYFFMAWYLVKHRDSFTFNNTFGGYAILHAEGSLEWFSVPVCVYLNGTDLCT
jgi:hypothetical protein